MVQHDDELARGRQAVCLLSLASSRSLSRSFPRLTQPVRTCWPALRCSPSRSGRGSGQWSCASGAPVLVPDACIWTCYCGPCCCCNPTSLHVGRCVKSTEEMRRDSDLPSVYGGGLGKEGVMVPPSGERDACSSTKPIVPCYPERLLGSHLSQKARSGKTSEKERKITRRLARLEKKREGKAEG